MAKEKTVGKEVGNLSQFWLVHPYQSQALDNFIPQSIRGQLRKYVCSCSGKPCAGASGVVTSWIRDEELLCEGYHRLNGLYYIAGF